MACGFLVGMLKAGQSPLFQHEVMKRKKQPNKTSPSGQKISEEGERMKSIKRVQKLISAMLLIFLAAFAFLIYRLQTEAGFYISNASDVSLGFVYDRNGDVLFDPDADAQIYGSDYFTDIGNLIGDNSGQMNNTLVSQNIGKLANFSFMLGEQEDGKAAIYCTLDHKVNRSGL